MTLRTKLIVGIVALITAVCAVIGVTTEIFLSRYLVKQVDNQVSEMQGPRNGPATSRRPDPDADDLTCQGGFGAGSGQSSLKSMSVVVQDGEVVSSGIVTLYGHAPAAPPVPDSSDRRTAGAARPTAGRRRSPSTASATTGPPPPS